MGPPSPSPSLGYRSFPCFWGLFPLLLDCTPHLLLTWLPVPVLSCFLALPSLARWPLPPLRRNLASPGVCTGTPALRCALALRTHRSERAELEEQPRRRGDLRGIGAPGRRPRRVPTGGCAGSQGRPSARYGLLQQRPQQGRRRQQAPQRWAGDPAPPPPGPRDSGGLTPRGSERCDWGPPRPAGGGLLAEDGSAPWTLRDSLWKTGARLLDQRCGGPSAPSRARCPTREVKGSAPGYPNRLVIREVVLNPYRGWPRVPLNGWIFSCPYTTCSFIS